MTRLEEIEERLAGATPVDPATTRQVRYEHGGGRMYVESGQRVGLNRDLILDVYDEGNREFYFNAPADIRHLVDRVKRLEAALTDINELTCLDHDEGGKIARAALAEPQP